MESGASSEAERAGTAHWGDQRRAVARQRLAKQPPQSHQAIEL